MKFKITFALLFVLSSSLTAAPRVDVVIGEKASPLEKLASDEMKSMLNKLFSAEVVSQVSLPKSSRHLIVLGTAQSNSAIAKLGGKLPKLSEQGHALKSIKLEDGRDALIVTGGSPRATLWAVTELGHHFGVRSFLFGDLYPVKLPELNLAGIDRVLEPTINKRGWRLFGDSPISAESWEISEHEQLLTQLAKLKFTDVEIRPRPWQPLAEPSKLNARNATIELFRGARFKVDGDTAGRTVFGGKKFFEPDWWRGADSQDKRAAIGELILNELQGSASRVGLEFSRLPALKEDATDPALTLTDTAIGVVPQMSHDTMVETLVGKKEVVFNSWSRDDAQLGLYLFSRAAFGAKLTAQQACDEMLTPVCGDEVHTRVLKAFQLCQDATTLLQKHDPKFGQLDKTLFTKHLASAEPPPAWWGQVRDNYLNAMNEMYRANTRAREGGRVFTLYFARRFECAFEFMNVAEAVRKSAVAKSKKEKETRIAELEKGIDSITGACNAMAAIARSNSDRGVIAVLNEYGYRPLQAELEAADAQ